VNDTAVDSVSNQKIKTKIKKKSSVAETRKGIILDRVSKDIKRTKLDQFLNKTIDVKHETFFEETMEKMVLKINKIKGLLNHTTTSIINRDFAKTKKFVSTYSAKYESISAEYKSYIYEEIECNSNRRNEKYCELLTQVKKNFGLLSDVVSDYNLFTQTDYVEIPSQDIKEKNENLFIAKLRSCSIVEEMINDNIYKEFGKSNTPFNMGNTTAKKMLNKNRSVIIDKGFRNVFIFYPR